MAGDPVPKIVILICLFCLFYFPKEFVKAVDSWREGKGATAGAKTSSSTSQALADKISQELEAAKEAMSLKLQKQKEEAERRMQEVKSQGFRSSTTPAPLIFKIFVRRTGQYGAEETALR